MVVIHISATIKNGAEMNFEQRLRAVVAEAHQTHGCLKYEWYRVPDVSNHFIIYGEFDSEDNFHVYLKSPIIQSDWRGIDPVD